MKMKCPLCQSEFYVCRGLLKEYVYKINTTYFCSYTCWRKCGGGEGPKSNSALEEQINIAKLLGTYEEDILNNKISRC